MGPDLIKLDELLTETSRYKAELVAVSKTKPVGDIMTVFEHGQAIFGENYVNELLEKQPQLSDKIQWHFIGHLQSNKVKYIAPFISLIHGIDSYKLLLEVNKHGVKLNRSIEVLLQVHIASEETKFGLSEQECRELFIRVGSEKLSGVRVRGLMGMASFTDDQLIVRKEFRGLRKLFDEIKSIPSGNNSASDFNTLSMGMSSDYQIALEEGSTMVRIGSMIFGNRK